MRKVVPASEFSTSTLQRGVEFVTQSIRPVELPFELPSLPKRQPVLAQGGPDLLDSPEVEAQKWYRLLLDQLWSPKNPPRGIDG